MGKYKVMTLVDTALASSERSRKTSSVGSGFSRLFRRRAANTPAFNLYGEAMRLGGEVYLTYTDKGTDDPLWDHILEVQAQVETLYKGNVTRAHLERLKSLAILHEIFELKDADGEFVWTPAQLRKKGFPRDFVDCLYALGRQREETYLVYIQRIAANPDAALVKIADLDVNTSPKRTKRKFDEVDEVFLDKKLFLYPGARDYLVASVTGDVDHTRVTPYQFLMSDPVASVRVPSIARLRRHWEFSAPKSAPAGSGGFARVIGAVRTLSFL